MKDRYCGMCNKPLLIGNKIVTKNEEFLSIKIFGIEFNWCNDGCYEKWYEEEIDNKLTYVNNPDIYFNE